MSRQQYLNSLAEECEVDNYVVNVLAEVLGENEDYDGLICALEDYMELYDEDCGEENY